MAKKLNNTLADVFRNTHHDSLMELSDRDLCAMVRAHFESHPTLPGEKVLKDQANQLSAWFDIYDEKQKARTQEILAAKPSGPEVMQSVIDKHAMEDTQEVLSAKPLGEEDVQRVMNRQKGIVFTPEEREEFVNGYLQTRFRETPLKEGNYYLDFRNFDPTVLKKSFVDRVPQNGATVSVDRVSVELQKNMAGEVAVMAEMENGGNMFIGGLPDKFLKNNPMNVDSCKADLQIIDYSNGKMKNLSCAVVVDTDLMSGDVIDLDDDMLDSIGYDKGSELE